MTYIPIDMEVCVQPACKGRPREFCTEQALAAALRVFWTKGYEGASLSDLTEAMGITRPSLYAAFGNKEALFRKALDLYEREKLAYVRQALAASSSRGVAERMLNGAVDVVTSDEDPNGCLGVICSVSCGPDAAAVKADIEARRHSSHQALLDRFEQARIEGDLPAATDVRSLADYLLAIIQGIAVQASSGASRKQLQEVARISLSMWPGR